MKAVEKRRYLVRYFTNLVPLRFSPSESVPEQDIALLPAYSIKTQIIHKILTPNPLDNPA